MRIMFVLGNYLPKPFANGICVDNLVRELQRRGHAVTCICDKKYYHATQHDNIDGIEIFRVCPDPVTECIDLMRMKKGYPAGVLTSCLKMFRKVLTAVSICIWPYDVHNRANRLFNAADKLLKQEKYDVLVCVNGPHASLIAGHKLKKKYPELMYVPYFLDALAGGPTDARIPPEKDLYRKLQFEEKYLGNADITIYMKSSKAFHDQYDKGKPHYGTIHYLDIPQIVNTTENISSTSRNKRIVYAGTISKKMRDPEYALTVFSMLEDCDFKLTFVGNNDCPEVFDRFKKKLGSKLELIPPVPHIELKRMMADADCLLNIGNINPNMTPSKVFEYMSYKKPILSFYSIEADTCIPYLNKYPYSLQIDQRRNNLEEACSTIRQWLFSECSERCCDFDLSVLFYENTPIAFAELLEETCENNTKEKLN